MVWAGFWAIFSQTHRVTLIHAPHLHAVDDQRVVVVEVRLLGQKRVVVELKSIL
jgi:hypothetical protein